MAKIFFSYSHLDEALRDRLEVHLSLLKQQKKIETWHDRRISAGNALDSAIDTNLESADIILLLVSADFIASKYCYSIEMKRALELHEESRVRVIPVILDACDWHSAPFGKLLAIPRDGKPVTLWSNQAEAWADAALQIRKVVEEMHKSPQAKSRFEVAFKGALIEDSLIDAKAGPISGIGALREHPRSSNLRLKKEFSDFDRDNFLHSSFDYMVKFFAASLDEIQARNEGIQSQFRRLDAQSFTAVIYRAGKTVAECSVRIGGLGGFGGSSTLSFSYKANAPAGSANEMLALESDTQSMFFRPFGMQSRGGDQSDQLSEQGASEHFWALFIERLQR